MPGGPLRVGLFVEPTPAMIARVLDIVKLDILQIYRAVEALDVIKDRFGLPIWRPIGINSAADLPTEALGAERFLLEAKPPAGANRPGGNATTFDWSVLRGWTAPAPWVLAGGLTPRQCRHRDQRHRCRGGRCVVGRGTPKGGKGLSLNPGVHLSRAGCRCPQSSGRAIHAVTARTQMIRTAPHGSGLRPLPKSNL